MVEPVPPKPRWKYLLIGYSVVLLALAPIFGGIVGLSIVLVPILLSMGLAVGTLSRMAKIWSCPRCKARVHTPEHVHRTLHLRAPHIREQAW